MLTCFTILSELNLSTLITSNRINDKLRCPVCGQVCEKRNDLDRHFQTHILNHDADQVFQHEAKSSEILILTNPNDDEKLVKNEHPYCKDKKVQECSWVCHYCGKSYKNRKNMRRHLKTHDQFKTFKERFV